jgi:beta-glucanase (GH16 family)
MKNFKMLIFPLALLMMISCIEKPDNVTECVTCISPTTYEGYTSTFTDEFNSIVLDDKWDYVGGNGCPTACGWGSGELQSYNEKNVEFRDGNLVITAKKETLGESQYTSGRISTLGTLSFTYGRIDVRAKLPKGQGLWAGIWLLGNNIKEVKWPTPGHISLMEMRGGEINGRNNTIIGKLLWGVPTKVEVLSDFISLQKGIFNDKFHVFSIIWEPTKIKWLLNDKVYFETGITPSMNGTFNKAFHININLAVGGQFPGNPDSSTLFPQELVIDYIRVFQKN